MSRTTHRRRLAAAGVLAATALVLSACGGSDDGDDPTEAEQTDGDAQADGDDAATGELTPITIGLIPIIDVAPIHIGIEQGFFEAHGLDVTAESGQGGAAIVPSVISGDFQFGFGNSMSTVIAASTGLDLQVVGSGVWSTGNRDEDAFVVMSADPDITSPTDLEGMTVATNTINAIGDSVVMASVEAAGGDPSGIEFLEMPFPSMPAAMVNGDVDAAWIVEPFVTVALAEGAHVVTPVLLDLADEFEIASYFTTTSYAEENPEIVEAFQAALTESLEYSQENPDAVRAILPTYLELPEGLEEDVILPAFRPGVSRETFQLYYDLAEDRGLLGGELDLDALLQHAD